MSTNSTPRNKYRKEMKKVYSSKRTKYLRKQSQAQSKANFNKKRYKKK